MDLCLGQFSGLVEKLVGLVFFAPPVFDLADQAVETCVSQIEGERALGLGKQGVKIGSIIRVVQITADFSYQCVDVERIQCKRNSRCFCFKIST